jgi:hypothetical protein
MEKERGQAKEKAMEEKRKRAREEEREKVKEKAREKAREEKRKRVKMKREKVKKVETRKLVGMKRAMTHRMAVISGASQPTLALGRQTSNCHVGQDYAEGFTSDSSWMISLETARCLSASSGRLPSEHWTDS